MVAVQHFLQALYDLGVEFWLPLPLVGCFLWFGGNQMTAQVLSQPHSSLHKLQADLQLDVNLSVTVMNIQATVDRKVGITYVEVYISDSTLKKLEFEYEITQLNQVEKLLGKELGLSQDNVRKLTRYRIVG